MQNSSEAQAEGLSLGARRIEAALTIVLAIALAGLVLGLAITRFGWAGGLIGAWPALALGGAAGCGCQEVMRRSLARRAG